MKKLFNRYIEIFLTLTILVGLFMPYAGDFMPLDFIFPGYIDHMDAFILTIPILFIIPFLLTLIFKDLLRNSLIRILKVVFILSHVIILGYYIVVFIDGYFGDDFVAATVAILLSLILLY